jgi:hypothetical protein
MQAYEAFPMLRRVPLVEFGEAFDRFTSSAFRLECLPRYAVEEETPFFNQYLSSGVCSLEFNKEWLDFLRTATASTKSVRRARVVPTPGSDLGYFLFEANCGYRRNIEAGEQIRFLPSADFETIAASFPFVLDFWMFDEMTVYAVHYDVRGVFLGASIAEGSLIQHFKDLAATAWLKSPDDALDDVLARVA